MVEMKMPKPGNKNYVPELVRIEMAATMAANARRKGFDSKVVVSGAPEDDELNRLLVQKINQNAAWYVVNHIDI